MIRLIFLMAGQAFWAASLAGQVYQPVFSNLSGPQLLDSVRARYKPIVVLDYANSRDTLYSRVLAKDDDSLRCIYSAHTLYLDPTQDPTQYVYLNGSSLGMNTEHAYPQAKGAETGNARSDMHHLYPARIPVNEARGNLPYADIPDAQTQQWFYKAQVFFSIPAQNRDLYSEANATAFEPREAVKGDLARAMFYFYTMYRAEADLADPNFFNIQRPTLCQWHLLDPADSAELVKTLRIALYQENKANPFILDCTLARRLYCPELPPTCTSSTTSTDEQPLALRLAPNPLRERAQLDALLPFSGRVTVRLYGQAGQALGRWEVPEAPAGLFQFQLDAPSVLPGSLGFFELELLGSGRRVRQLVPVVFW